MRKTRLIVSLQIFALIFAGCISTAQAAVVSTADYFAAVDATSQLSQIDTLMAQEQVKELLLGYGVEQADVMERVAALSPGELQLLSQQLEAAPAGGILGLIGAVFVVLLILELVGVTNIFNKI